MFSWCGGFLDERVRNCTPSDAKNIYKYMFLFSSLALNSTTVPCFCHCVPGFVNPGPLVSPLLRRRSVVIENYGVVSRCLSAERSRR